MPTKEQQRAKLIGLLKELFQLNQPDLDFGFYRVMHAKAKEVTEFLENDLLKIAEAAFGQVNEARIGELQKAYEDAIVDAKRYGAANPEETDPVKQAKATLDAAADTSRAEGEVYDHLYRFFERYYDGGDFLSRRYLTRETEGKAAPYAIPYNGEEVKLHWANADQYYIKTTEYFNNYRFDLAQAPEVLAKKGELFETDDLPPLPVEFRIVQGAEGEHGNIKAGNGQKRYFVIHAENPVSVEGGHLTVHFEYHPDPEKPKKGTESKWQETRRDEAVEAILEAMEGLEGAGEYTRLLQTLAPTDNQKDRTLLAAYLSKYVARNTMDYFIHKDLGSFLRRELDFYIKNEVMRLDDIEAADAPKAEQYLGKLKVLRAIARKLIEFLAQLEDFQKRLWLKKKFVVETNYCITLDLIPEELYSEIAANDAQREEWVQLFLIDEIQGNLVTPGYSAPLTVEFLKANSRLILDTRFFSADFIWRLEAHIDDLDSRTDGHLVHSDNFQALQLLGARYGEQVKCIYIDPPYNTDSSSIPYKNSYRHSSWVTMMHDRLRALKRTLARDGAVFVSIDKTERTVLEHVMDDVFGSENRVEELIWAMNTNNSQAPNYSTNHEYVEVYAKDRQIAEKDRDMFREPKPGFDEVMALVARLDPLYPPVSTIESELRKLYSCHKAEYREEVESRGTEWEGMKSADPWKGLFNYNRAEYRDAAGNVVEEAEAEARGARIWVWRESDSSMPAAKQAESTRDSDHPNWRFYKPLHPITKKPCPHPKSGWKYAYEDDADSPERRSFVSLDGDNRIAWGPDEKKVPQLKRFLQEVETNVGKSVFQDYSDGEKQTSAMFGKSGLFLAPKHSDFVSRFIIHAAREDSVILDCFGGSGSTAHAVIKLNRDGQGKHKYVLVEVEQYFDAILKPRVLKAAYSSDWRGGKPISRNGASHCVKILRLESYEDCLNNLNFVEDETRDKLMAQNPQLREDYMLRYMLDVETRGSQSLLNIDGFKDPTAYKLKVKKPGSDEYEWRNVDLLETFNYLIGLRVEHIAAPQVFTAEFKREPDPDLPEDQNTKLILDGKLKQDPDGPWWFRKVEGWVPTDMNHPNNGHKERMLIVWRRLTGDMEKDNLMLDEWFNANRISTRDFEFDTIYVNGSNNLPNLRQEGDTWKVRLIEEDFHKLMWDVEDV